MFGDANFDLVRQTFQDQFSNDSHGLVYRKGQKGLPIRVSELERDDFVVTFNKRIGYAAWSIFPATVILILLLVWLVPDIKSPIASVVIWVGLGAILGPFMAIFYWAWNAPARELQRRTPEGSALTKEEARALAFSKITYGRLALAAVMGLGLVFRGGDLVWLVFGGILVALAAIQAIRKWRFNQQ